MVQFVFLFDDFIINILIYLIYSRLSTTPSWMISYTPQRSLERESGQYQLKVLKKRWFRKLRLKEKGQLRY